MKNSKCTWGCGANVPPTMTQALARAGGSVTGVDPSEELIVVARRHAMGLPVAPPTYVCDTIEHHSSQLVAHYDIVIASEVIEHVPNPESFLKGCIAALKPGGSLFTTTPNRTALSWFGAIFICENVLKIVPSGFHSWKQFIHHPELEAMIQSMGCNVRKVRGMFYDPLRNKWSWCFTPTLMYAIHSVKIHWVKGSADRLWRQRRSVIICTKLCFSMLKMYWVSHEPFYILKVSDNFFSDDAWWLYKPLWISTDWYGFHLFIGDLCRECIFNKQSSWKIILASLDIILMIL